MRPVIGKGGERIQPGTGWNPGLLTRLPTACAQPGLTTLHHSLPRMVVQLGRNPSGPDSRLPRRRSLPMGPQLPAALPAENIYIQICPRVPCFCLKPAGASVLTTWEARCDFIRCHSSTGPRMNKKPGLAGWPPPTLQGALPWGLCTCSWHSSKLLPHRAFAVHRGSRGVRGSSHLSKKPFLPNITQIIFSADVLCHDVISSIVSSPPLVSLW